MRFQGKRVIITGAGKGIGRDLALRLAGEGAEIAAMARTAADLDSLRAEIGGTSHVVDLGDAEAARKAAREAVPADLLVNCAGMNIPQPFLETTVEAFDTVNAVNTRSALIVSQEYAKARIAAGGGGAIVNVSSMSAFYGWADHAAYCASKGGMDAMSRVMANELGRHGIRVNCINPTVTMTELAVESWSAPEKSGPMLARIPIGRFAETEDVSGLIAFLLSDDAAMINGVAIPIDGGLMAC
ncbi:SDR family oxidoreductase [Aliiruegeria lutimaris]|uniref:NAD(P)-dependent dehydrogenase, short-chain alcohol dehydrogenase family n=1 Tax=Aliiruegeria lutimaris TaxID=571298 RepID=A0A1G8XS37_9RHOB|nr:SDR family oxidoreductase [Aliiruegeria lutimaris]SDJ92994.1 NAD(P)-dependent dehydrogenase, short-chain alcohol dehydrogenase family [Aliiruegeria lutimaris]